MRRRDNAGFTLVELLVAIIIMSTIVGTLSTAIIVGLRTSDDTAHRRAGLKTVFPNTGNTNSL